LIVKVFREKGGPTELDREIETHNPPEYGQSGYSRMDPYELGSHIHQPYTNYFSTSGSRPSTAPVYPETSPPGRYWRGRQYPPVRYEDGGRYNSAYNSRQNLVGCVVRGLGRFEFGIYFDI